MTTRPPDADLLPSLRALVSLSTLDVLYADLYLYRAEGLLPAVYTRQQYQALRHDQLSLPRLTAELRHASDQSDWPKVRTLAHQGAELRERLAAASQIFPLADAVYGPRSLHADATTLALSGVVAQPDSNLVRAREAVLDQLRLLTLQDREWARLYESRIEYFEQCRLVSGEPVGPMVDQSQLRQQILTAVAAGDFTRVQRLTDLVVAESATSSGRLRAPRPSEDRVRELAARFPESAVDRAADLGLTMETVPHVSGLNEYLSCGCSDRATFPETPLSETHRNGGNCTCGHACPPDVRPSLRDNLDFLMGHPFISSAGRRYLPWFGRETLLVETFPDTDPEARTALSSALGLTKRRGLSRLVIEDALLTNGPHVCAKLGLDPAEHIVACIPWDAYVRLAPKYAWGQQEFWTHMDGYQVTRELGLWALVGGNAHYGGGDNLSTLVREYDSERLVGRFALLRRARFGVRETQGIQ